MTNDVLNIASQQTSIRFGLHNGEEMYEMKVAVTKQ